MTFRKILTFILVFATLKISLFWGHEIPATGFVRALGTAHRISALDGRYSLVDNAKLVPVTAYEPMSEVSSKPRYLISRYDTCMRQVAAELNLDWRFLSAIGYHESRFRSDLRSPVGAIGLMQVMPSTARIFGVDPNQARDPKTNIKIAARLIHRIEKSMGISNLQAEDRMSLVLACYNGGIGHVSDARRLTAKYGQNPNSWADVSKYLLLKGTEAYVDDDVVRHGEFSGKQTVAFVDNVMKSYRKYCRKTS